MSNQPPRDAVIEFLFKMADDQLIIGHRNSEWTGLGPVLEEDIAFSSLAQDKIGHAWNLYQILEDLGKGDPDQLAFKRPETAFKCCHLVEYPIGEYDFSLIRHFLFDHAELLRFEMLENSSFPPLAQRARKFKGEIKYHIYHADTWVSQLGKGGEESRSRLQSSLNEIMPLALGIFEPGPHEDSLIESDVFAGETALREKWLENIQPVIESAGLQMPDTDNMTPVLGGRKGYHSPHLKPLLAEMSEVLNKDPDARW